MNQNSLSQDEVESLFHGIADDDQNSVPRPAERPAAAVHTRSAAVHPCDLTSQVHVVPGDMPGLEAIHKRFVKELHDGLRRFTNKDTGITGGNVEVQNYADFLGTIGSPTNINVVTLSPLRGSGLIVCDPALIYGMVDALFGGRGRVAAVHDGRTFSRTELRIIERLVEVVIAAYGKAWAQAYPLAFAYQRSEMHPQFANVARASDTVLVSRYSITCGGATGALHLCFPYSTLDPIRETLYTPARDEALPREHGWSERLTHEIQSANVDLVAELAQASATVAQLLALKPGDFMEVDLGPSMRAMVDGVPVFQCHYGTSNGKNAIKIDQPIASAEQDWIGAPHV